MGAALLPVVLAAQPLTYTVSWLGIPVADVSINITETDSGMLAEYRARTRPWFDPFYPVDNRYRVWVDGEQGYPQRYEKDILERGRADRLWAYYEHNPQRVIYANGMERPWREGAHTLFSALLWVQRHEWQAGEEHLLLVEVEGVTWEVTVTCAAVPAQEETGDLRAQVGVRFGQPVSGEPVLSSTDILTYMLPGEGHELRLELDLGRDEVTWVEMGSKPFQVRAEMDSARDDP